MATLMLNSLRMGRPKVIHLMAARSTSAPTECISHARAGRPPPPGAAGREVAEPPRCAWPRGASGSSSQPPSCRTPR
eukprot:5145935-Pyramimonas_sp.AAC.1